MTRMEEGQEPRFVCKLCNKKYPCGKSLGGHMRSHVVANSAESQDRVEAVNMSKVSSSGGGGGAGQQQSAMNESKVAELEIGHSSYGLRENPRKTWRAVDSACPLPPERVCKQCGKGFQSLKALCGHMACHSERDRDFKDDHSWTSENQKLVLDSDSDTEAEERILRTRSSKANRYKKLVVKSPFPLANNGSSSGSEVDGEEQEEVAMCLMLLSRDSGNKGGVTSVVESSDNNSVILETKSSSIDMRTGKKEHLLKAHNQEDLPLVKKIGDVEFKDGTSGVGIAQMENSDSGYFLDECAKAESDVSVDGFRRNCSFSEYSKPLMSGRGEENGAAYRHSLNRKRTYRAEMKREWTKQNEYYNGGMALYSENGRINRNDPPNAEVLKRSKYECFNCKKTFKSYQALGGHRPCHKRSNAFYESRYEIGENSLDDSTEFVTSGKTFESAGKGKSSAKNSSHYADKKNKAKKNKGHVCPFCNRVFKNGQALGGHKRSHFIGGHEETSNRSPTPKPELLDLNLPAPEDDNEGHDQFSPW